MDVMSYNPEWDVLTRSQRVEVGLWIQLYGRVVEGFLYLGGIHPGRIEPASPTEQTTSRVEAHQARRYCASSLETFTQSFLLRA